MDQHGKVLSRVSSTKKVNENIKLCKSIMEYHKHYIFLPPLMKQFFFDASSHLFRRICTSICPSICLSLCPSLRPYVCMYVCMYVTLFSKTTQMTHRAARIDSFLPLLAMFSCTWQSSSYPRYLL